MKFVFSTAQKFVGKKASEQAYAFIEWIVQYTEKFQKAAVHLEKLFEKETTTHTVVITPDSHTNFLKNVNQFFKDLGTVEFIVNRSVTNFKIPEGNDPFLQGLRHAEVKERKLLNYIQKDFHSPQISKIPLMLMGEDTREEIMKFVEAG